MRRNDQLPPLFQSTITSALDALSQNQVVERMWQKDYSLWKQ